MTGRQAAKASFAKDGLYEWPSELIMQMVKNLPETEKLSRLQTLFVVMFAKNCDVAWFDENGENKKPPDL